jgi:lipopolysaccharide/colanic/teichoic acid biosynthesis glycosyltransferase
MYFPAHGLRDRVMSDSILIKDDTGKCEDSAQSEVCLQLEEIVQAEDHIYAKRSFLIQKRVMDFVLSSAALFFGLPLFLLVTLLVKLTSRGPVFFAQERVGLEGTKFTLFKFRSMIDGAHRQRHDLESLNEMSGTIFKIKNDPRFSPIGRLLRKTSLDELPQLWNVLKGDMSLVGPRPHASYEVKNYRQSDWRRLLVKPGLTCYWQIQGRSLLDFDTCVQLDLQYIKEMSWATDIKILLKTLPAVISGKGAM